jgi:cytochrome b561
LTTLAATYTRAAVGLHWAIALLIFAAFPLGLYMHGLPLSPNKLRLYNYHKWIGVTVLILAILRVALHVRRITHRPPDVPGTTPKWEQFVAQAMHYLLYMLIFAVPLSGWLTSSAQGFQTVWFGVIPLPDLVGKDKEMANVLKEIHKYLNYAMLALVGVHIAAALKHYFIARDEILANMIPFLRRSRGKSAANSARPSR